MTPALITPLASRRVQHGGAVRRRVTPASCCCRFFAWWLCLGVPPLRQSRTVTFPPAEAPPPPPAKAPPKTQAGGEETDILPAAGPAMRKTQHRTPPPPTNLTIMYKVEYGEILQYKHADGTVQKFEQWKSYPNDAFNLVTLTNERLADGNNYQYATKPLASPGFDPVDIPHPVHDRRLRLRR